MRKSKSFPTDITVETVLSPTMTPKDPVIRIDVPPNKSKEPLPTIARNNSIDNMMRKEIEKRGRDEVAQSLDTPPPMNREQRRALKRK